MPDYDIETESERLMRVGANQGAARMIAEHGQGGGLDNEIIIKRMQEKSRIVFRTVNGLFKGVWKTTCIKVILWICFSVC